MRKTTLLAVVATGGLASTVGFTVEPAGDERRLTVVLKEKDGASRMVNPDDVVIRSGDQELSVSQLVRRLDAVGVYSYRVGARDVRTKRRLPVSVEFVEPRLTADRREDEYRLGFPRPGSATSTDGPTVQYEWCDVEPSEIRISSVGYKAVVRKVAPSLSAVVDLEPEQPAEK